MGFKNPSVNQLNTKKIESDIAEIKNTVNLNNTIMKESLDLLKSITSSMKSPLNEEKTKDEESIVTYISGDNIPKTLEASEGMQRVLNLGVDKINALKLSFFPSNKVEEAVIEQNNEENLVGTDDIVPMKL